MLDGQGSPKTGKAAFKASRTAPRDFTRTIGRANSLGHGQGVDLGQGDQFESFDGQHKTLVLECSILKKEEGWTGFSDGRRLGFHSLQDIIVTRFCQPL